MNIKILYDNQAKAEFRSGWGFAALINDSTLFDTGENAEALLANLQMFGIEPAQIRQIVLSHQDWDHIGGISILKQCGSVKVYIPASFSGEIKKGIIGFNPDVKLIEIEDATEITQDMTVTRELGTEKKEISLAIRTSRGIVLVVGCSHPGLDEIIAHTSKLGNIYAVTGGFHGFSKLEALSGIPLIVPTHCTQKKQEISDMYPKQTRFVSAGMEIRVE